MDTVKTIIYSACVVGIVSTMLEIAAPEGTLKKQLDLIMGLVLVMVVITPFMDKSFKFRLNDFTADYDQKICEQIKDSERSVVLETARKELSEYLTKKLNDSGVNCKDVIISLQINEYNQIEITNVQVSADKGSADRITEIIKGDLPKAEITITAGDSS